MKLRRLWPVLIQLSHRGFILLRLFGWLKNRQLRELAIAQVRRDVLSRMLQSVDKTSFVFIKEVNINAGQTDCRNDILC